MWKAWQSTHTHWSWCNGWIIWLNVMHNISVGQKSGTRLTGLLWEKSSASLCRAQMLGVGAVWASPDSKDPIKVQFRRHQSCAYHCRWCRIPLSIICLGVHLRQERDCKEVLEEQEIDHLALGIFQINWLGGRHVPVKNYKRALICQLWCTALSRYC